MISTPTLEQLKAADPDRCRAAMFADKTTRERLLLLYAFHYELAKVPELVSEPMIGAIRYQWWRDAIAEIYEGKAVRQHEITTPLAKLVKDCDIPRFWLDKLIDGRERDLDPRPFTNISEAKSYSSNTSGVLAGIGAHITASEYVNIAWKFGEVWGMTGLLRGWPYYKNSILKEINSTLLFGESHVAYVVANDKIKSIPPELMPAIVYVALIPGFQSRFNESEPKAYPPLAKKMRLLLTSITGKLPD